MRDLMTELGSFRTCRSRATWALVLGAVSFCLGAFTFALGAPSGTAMTVVVVGCLGVVVWAATGQPLGILPSAAVERTAWAVTAFAASALGSAIVFFASGSQ